MGETRAGKYGADKETVPLSSPVSDAARRQRNRPLVCPLSAPLSALVYVSINPDNFSCVAGDLDLRMK